MSIEHGRILNNCEAAQYLNLSPSTMNKHRMTGTGPVYFKLGRRVGYRLADLDAWLALNQRRSTSIGSDFISEY